MKRGKDEEKIMGPMFPRLHVNDTEKGGPRAPPRNKMALYEQLSIPSQRFKSGMPPANTNKTSNLVPVASPTEGSGYRRSMLYQSQLTRSDLVENVRSNYSGLSAPCVQPEHKRKVDEDDFRVPIFSHSEVNQDHGNCNGNNKEQSSSSAAFLRCSMKPQGSLGEEPNHIESSSLTPRGDEGNQSEGSSREVMPSRKQYVKPASVQSSRDEPQDLLNSSNAVPTDEHRSQLANNDSCKLAETVGESHREPRAESQLKSSASDVIASHGRKGIRNGISCLPVEDFESSEDRIPDTHTTDVDSFGDKPCRSVQTGNVDRGDDASEASIVDSISGLEISPDDVVGIIGQKHFWKARRAIINQQRLFAGQVFELHRLIKVQRLIAGAPNLLVENHTYLGRRLMGSPVKKLPLEYVVKIPSKIDKHKDESAKANHNMEISAENAVGKTSIYSLQNGTQPSNNVDNSGNHHPVVLDPKLSPWSFQQPPGHQWLIPVMSPSEGLVYKPYPGPGFPSSFCGGCGSPGSTPIMGNFLYPGYGHPASVHPYHGMGAPPFVPATGHGYFPPYGMPIMYPTISGSTVEQMKPFSSQGLHGQLPAGAASFNQQHQSLSSVPSQKNGAVSTVVKVQMSKDTELQISTASSPSERTQGAGTPNTTDGRNALSLFPTSPAVNTLDLVPQRPEATRPEAARSVRVIRVVPHNARSATESAARIFRSIQEERKQHDSI